MTTNDRIQKPAILVTRKLLPEVEARMAELFDASFNSDDIAMSHDAIISGLEGCSVLVPTVTDQIDAKLINAAPDSLKLIAQFGAGVNNIDLDAAKKRGIIVTNTPGVFTDDTADLTMALILSVPRRLSEGQRLVRQNDWKGWSPSGMLGHRVSGKKLGILGFGRIGEAVASRARAFGMEVHYTKRKRLPPVVEEKLGVAWEPDLDRLLSRSDIVSLHCPLTEETAGILSKERLAKMKSESYLINTSRGELVDDEALIAALQNGDIAGAGLDVYTHEPAVDPRLLELSNVVLIPHMGSATFEGRRDSGECVITNIRVWADGHRPPNQVLDGF